MELNRDRLARFQQLLRDDAAKPDGVQFDMNAWAYPSDAESKRRAYEPDTKTVTVNCGTKACALGLAAISGVFKAEGLDWKIHLEDGDDEKGMLVPTFDGKIDYEAGMESFGLSGGQAVFLFDPWEYTNGTTGAEAENEVIKRVQWLLDGNNTYDYPKDE